jgi:hypothetical protein
VIYVVGESLGSGGTRRRLASLFEVSENEMMDAVLWLNLWEYPGTRPERYVRLVEESAEPLDAVVLLGRRVQRAFGLERQEALSTIVRSSGTTILCLPHPSGLNRWWNDPAHVREATEALRALWGAHSR